MNKKQDSIIFNANALGKYLFLILLINIILLILHVQYNIIPIIILLIPFYAILIILGLFTSQTQNLFSRRAVLEFYDDRLDVAEYHLKNDTLLNNYSISWADINSYQYYDAGRGDIINLKLYFNNGKSKLMKFRGENISINEAIANENSLFRILHSFIKNYNSKSNDHKIYFREFFMMTNGGYIFIWGIPIACAITFLIRLSLNDKAAFIWLFVGLMLTPMFVALKKKHTTTYDKIIALG